MFFKRLTFIALFFYSTAAATTQYDLPLPFAAFDDLYLDTSTSTFYGIGKNIVPGKALAPQFDRGYSFALSKNRRKFQNVQTVEETTLFLFEMPATESYCTHFFHLLEHIIGLWSFYGNEQREDIHLIILASSGKNKENSHWQGPNQINKHLLKALFPNAVVKTWADFLANYPRKLLHFEHAVTSDRGLTPFSDVCRKMNKHLGEAHPYLSATALNELANCVHEYAHTRYENNSKTVVTYLKRPIPRTLEPQLENQLLQQIREIPGVDLIVADFANLSFQEQIKIIGNTDVLLSVHGNGLSHILFLRPSASAIEIFPAKALRLDYMLFANARKIEFLEVSSDLGVISKEAAYERGCFGDINSNPTIYSLDTQPILDFIRHKTER